MDRYYYRPLPFFRQFLFIPNRNNKFMDPTTNCSTTRFNQFRRIIITCMAKMFGFRNSILNALHCKIHCINNVKLCSLPFVKFLEFHVDVLLQSYILINSPKIHDTWSKYSCKHKHVSIIFYMNDTKHTFMLFKQRILQCNILTVTLANRSRR